MRTFTDNAGRSWNVQIDTAAIRDVRRSLDVNLLQLPEDDFKLFDQLVSDPVMLVDVLFVVCRGQAETLGVSDEDFGRAMAGDAIMHATDALVREVVDFFPDARRRTLLGKVVDKGQELGELLLETATAQSMALDGLDLHSAARKLIASCGNSPVSSG